MADRDDFEAWYVADANSDGVVLKEDSIKKMREGDYYGDHRTALNSKWEGWRARSLFTEIPGRYQVIRDPLNSTGWQVRAPEGFLVFTTETCGPQSLESAMKVAQTSNNQLDEDARGRTP